MTDIFYECSNLDNYTLNEILKICINAPNLDEEYCDKTLSAIVLTEEQVTIGQSLSNYNAFISAGWTAGY